MVRVRSGRPEVQKEFQLCLKYVHRGYRCYCKKCLGKQQAQAAQKTARGATK